MKKIGDKIFPAFCAVLVLAGYAWAAGPWSTIGRINSVASNNADGTPPTFVGETAGSAAILFRLPDDRSGNTIISIAPKSPAGTVGQVNSPNGTTAVNATLELWAFPACYDTSNCTATLQRHRTRVGSNSVSTNGLMVEDQLFGTLGVLATTMNFGGVSVSSADAYFEMKYRPAPAVPTRMIPDGTE